MSNYLSSAIVLDRKIGNYLSSAIDLDRKIGNYLSLAIDFYMKMSKNCRKQWPRRGFSSRNEERWWRRGGKAEGKGFRGSHRARKSEITSEKEASYIG